MKSFKVGDRVIKARPYSTDSYCRFGGNPESAPIGTEGIVIRADGEIVVRFPKTTWSVDITEIDSPTVSNWKERCTE